MPYYYEEINFSELEKRCIVLFCICITCVCYVLYYYGLTKCLHILQINEFLKKDEAMSIDEVAMGFIKVANEAMCRPIRALTQVQSSLFFSSYLALT